MVLVLFLEQQAFSSLLSLAVDTDKVYQHSGGIGGKFKLQRRSKKARLRLRNTREQFLEILLIERKKGRLYCKRTKEHLHISIDCNYILKVRLADMMI